jgi:hypothetical protein
MTILGNKTASAQSVCLNVVKRTMQHFSWEITKSFIPVPSELSVKWKLNPDSRSLIVQ